VQPVPPAVLGEVDPAVAGDLLAVIDEDEGTS